MLHLISAVVVARNVSSLPSASTLHLRERILLYELIIPLKGIGIAAPLPPLLHSALRDGILKFLADKLAVRLDLASFVIFIGMSRKGPSHLNLYPPVTCYSADPSTKEPP